LGRNPQTQKEVQTPRKMNRRKERNVIKTEDGKKKIKIK